MQMVHLLGSSASLPVGADGTLLLLRDISLIKVLSEYTALFKIELYGMFSCENGKWVKINF